MYVFFASSEVRLVTSAATPLGPFVAADVRRRMFVCFASSEVRLVPSAATPLGPFVAADVRRRSPVGRGSVKMRPFIPGGMDFNLPPAPARTVSAA